jgi:hypothetical protein
VPFDNQQFRAPRFVEGLSINRILIPLEGTQKTTLPGRSAPITIENVDTLEAFDYFLSVEVRFMDITDCHFPSHFGLLKITILLVLKICSKDIGPIDLRRYWKSFSQVLLHEARQSRPTQYHEQPGYSC